MCRKPCCNTKVNDQTLDDCMIVFEHEASLNNESSRLIVRTTVWLLNHVSSTWHASWIENSSTTGESDPLTSFDTVQCYNIIIASVGQGQPGCDSRSIAIVAISATLMWLQRVKTINNGIRTGSVRRRQWWVCSFQFVPVWRLIDNITNPHTSPSSPSAKLTQITPIIIMQLNTEIS